VKSDTILYEKYFNNYNQESVVTTFSIAKSFVSSLIGIAISEGYIDNVNDPITKYLPYIDKEEFADLTIKNLLNMRSGLDANEGYYNPFGDVAKYYYGTNLKKYLTKIKKKETPGKHYEYLSVNTQLLADIIEHTTKKSVSQYLQEKIWEPLQMESDATWSIDSKRNKTVKAYCCINAKARDFAKFGRLYLNKGKWNGKQIVPEEWVYNSSHATNNSKTRLGYFYSYQWRGTDDGAFFARGLLGQYIFVYPKYDFIAIRFGKDYGDVNWIDFFTPIAKEL
ncbi:MAG: serine hydrolase, partial [Bacteroidota bacterium]|nr:serine hydrolase [Bacteroidota bacterium]